MNSENLSCIRWVKCIQYHLEARRAFQAPAEGLRRVQGWEEVWGWNLPALVSDNLRWVTGLGKDQGRAPGPKTVKQKSSSVVTLETRSGRKGWLRGEGKLGGLIDIFTIFIVAIVSWCVQECSVMCDSLGPPGLWPTMLLCPCNSSCKNTGVDSRFFSRGSSWPRNQTHVSCISCLGRLVL